MPHLVEHESRRPLEPSSRTMVQAFKVGISRGFVLSLPNLRQQMELNDSSTTTVTLRS